MCPATCSSSRHWVSRASSISRTSHSSSLKTACPICMTMYASVIGTFLDFGERPQGQLARCRRVSVAISPTVAADSDCRNPCCRLARGLRGTRFRIPETTTGDSDNASGSSSAPRRASRDADAGAARPSGRHGSMRSRASPRRCRQARRKFSCSSSTTISARRAVWRGCSTRTSSRSTRRRTPASSCSRIATSRSRPSAGQVNARHAAACEAAAAVRMAREKSRDKDLEATLFEKPVAHDDSR